MKTGQLLHPSLSRVVAIALMWCVAAITPASDVEQYGGVKQGYVEKPDSWEEQDVVLPAYPEEKNLMDLGIATVGMQYTVYLDKPSLVRGDDGVVRYTVVLVPTSGLWNVSNEGLRCGEKQFRRYAYGFEGGWQQLNNSPWRDVQGGDANRYRRILYERYFCNPLRPYQSVEEMIKSFTETWHEDM
jgi:hypothetical protein